MDSYQTWLAACFVYLAWAYLPPKEFFHRVWSVLFVSETLLWHLSTSSSTSTSLLSSILFVLGLLLCILFSPLPVVTRILTDIYYKRSVQHGVKLLDRSILELVPYRAKGVRKCEYAKVDIIAVHGLGSHPLEAWRSRTAKLDDKEYVLWLRDFLLDEKELHPRVLVYSHDSQYFAGALRKTLEEHGDDLLRAIQRTRENSEALDRPLILIGHSFGGLVVKQMLVNAAANYGDVDRQRLLRTISGLIFMGTPHHGAHLTTIAKLRSMLHFWEGSSTVILDVLDPRSPVNARLHELFMRLLPNLCGLRNTLNIIEAVPQGYRGLPLTPVVSRDSAIIHGCEYINSPEDHRTIQRFSSREDPTYQDIVIHMRKCLTWQTSNLASQNKHAGLTSVPAESPWEKDDILPSLGFSSMGNRHDQIRTPHANTCQWILKHPKFLLWQQGHDPVLWVRGGPGTGKSTLITFIADRLENAEHQQQTLLELQFYFNAGSEKLESSYEGLLRTMLHQLYLGDEGARECIRRHLHVKVIINTESKQDWRWQRKHLASAFRDACRVVHADRLIILIDALDEAGREEILEISSFLETLRDDSDADDRRLMICISSRRYPVVTNMPGLCIDLETNNNADITAFMKHSLDSQGSRLCRLTLDRAAWHDTVTELTSKAASNFKWAAVVVNLAFELANRGYTVKMLRVRLLSLPKELSKLYRHILANVVDPQDRPDALLLLQWVCLAGRPLSLKELRHAMVIERMTLSWKDSEGGQPSCNHVDEFIEADDGMLLRSIAITGDLLQVFNRSSHKHGFVQVSHQSVMEFMLEEGFMYLAGETGFPAKNQMVMSGPRLHNTDLTVDQKLRVNWNLDMLISASHERLFMTCLSYLMLEEPDQRRYRWDTISEHAIDKEGLVRDRPFIKYAKGRMFYHATKAQSFRKLFDCDGMDLRDCLDMVFESWFVAFRMLHCSSYCPLDTGTTLLHYAAFYNLEGVVRSMLPYHCINNRDCMDHTALHFSVLEGHDDISRLLISNGADPVTEFGALGILPGDGGRYEDYRSLGTDHHPEEDYENHWEWWRSCMKNGRYYTREGKFSVAEYFDDQ